MNTPKMSRATSKNIVLRSFMLQGTTGGSGRGGGAFSISPFLGSRLASVADHGVEFDAMWRPVSCPLIGTSKTRNTWPSSLLREKELLALAASVSSAAMIG